jgi:hypothetical protein
MLSAHVLSLETPYLPPDESENDQLIDLHIVLTHDC